jgi:hypothetical protein
VLAPRLLAAFGSQRERYANAAEVQGYSGIAPVTEQSGKKGSARQSVRVFILRGVLEPHILVL